MNKFRTFIVIGAALIAGGFYFIWPPTGLIAGGLLIIIIVNGWANKYKREYWVNDNPTAPDNLQVRRVVEGQPAPNGEHWYRVVFRPKLSD